MQREAAELVNALGIAFVFLAIGVVATLVSAFQLPIDWVREDHVRSSLHMVAAITSTALIGVGFGFSAALRLSRDVAETEEQRESRSRERSSIRLQFEQDVAVYRNNQRLLAIRFDEGNLSASEFHDGYVQQERIIGVVHEQHFSRMAGI